MGHFPAPHVGHLYTMVLTDVIKRWQQLKGRTAILCTGTDEHGIKVQHAAALTQTDPGTFCYSGANSFKVIP
jgi:methionyl-tRNA synthetase